MDLLAEDEKKEGNGEDKDRNGIFQEEDSDSSGDGDDEVVDLPPELAILIGPQYQTEEKLQEDLDEAGIGDLPIILDKSGKPCLVMPSDQHNYFTSTFVCDFASDWSRWGFCTGTHNIHLPDGKTRLPDLSYWGYPRCQKNALGLVPIGNAIPDVVIQFCWKNKKSYEEEAINDMMTQGLESVRGDRSQTYPRVGYLIKMKFSKKRMLSGGTKTQDLVGMDIYRMPYNTTTQDAINGTNGASKWSYRPGDDDSEIVITPQDLGITGLWAIMCGSYKLSVARVFERMNKFHKEQQALLAT